MTWFDTAVMHWVVTHSSPLGDQVALGVMAVCTNPVTIGAIALLCLGYAVVRHRYRLVAGVVLAVLTSMLVAGLLKQIVGRARPAVPMALVFAGGPSMPSTDAAITAAAAVALYVGLTWLHPQPRRIVPALLVVSVTAIGLCLVYLGVHWPTDVMAGWALGAVIGVAAAAVMALA